MPTAVKGGLVFALVLVVGYTLWIVSQGGEPKSSLDLDARAPGSSSDLASDLSASMNDKSTKTPAAGRHDSSTPKTETERPHVNGRRDRSSTARPERETSTPPITTRNPEPAGGNTRPTPVDNPAARRPEAPTTFTPIERPARRPATNDSGSPDADSTADASEKSTPVPRRPSIDSSANRPTFPTSNATVPTAKPVEPGDAKPEDTHTTPPAAGSEPPKTSTDVPLRPRLGGDRSAQTPVTPETERPARRSDPTPPAARSTPTEGTQRTHVIEAGDRIIDLADRYYQDESLYTVILEANPGVDPSRLKIGQKIVIPPKPTAEAKPANGTTSTRAPSGEPIYVVERGDNLTIIARNVLKDETRWREIFELNRDVLASPDRIQVGMKLKMPPLKKTTQPAKP